MDFLLVDPSDTMLNLIPKFTEIGVSVGVVITEAGFVPDTIDTDSIKLINLQKNSWDTKLQIVSAIAWSYTGFQFVENISNQILLSNVDTNEFKSLRAQQYLTSPISNGTTYFETLSYKGRHVLINANKYDNDKWNTRLEFDQQLIDQIELVWANLDNTGTITGPCQTYLLPNGDIRLKFNTASANWVANRELVTRHFLDVWPWLVKTEPTNPKGSLRRFNVWVEKTGNSKRFRFQ